MAEVGAQRNAAGGLVELGAIVVVLVGGRVEREVLLVGHLGCEGGKLVAPDVDVVVDGDDGALGLAQRMGGCDKEKAYLPAAVHATKFSTETKKACHSRVPWRLKTVPIPE